MPVSPLILEYAKSMRRGSLGVIVHKLSRSQVYVDGIDAAQVGRPFYRAVVWQRLDVPGMEYCELSRARRGWALRGEVVVAPRRTPPSSFRYIVRCNSRWWTRSAFVEARRAGTTEQLTLEVDREQRWWSGGQEIASLRGCLDVDLGFTPATNTITLRRLALEVERSANVTVAWVRLDDLAVLSLAQRYRRVSATAYDYESRSGFATRLTVDDSELVASYPPCWTRVSVEG